jgi:hypothetical protein
MNDEQKYYRDLSQLADFVFELQRVTGSDSKYRIRLEGEEWDDFEVAYALLDKLSLRVLDTEERVADYELYQKEVRAEYWATRGVCSGPVGGRK